VGSPGSGKSSFARKVFADYHYVNQDTLKTKQRCVEELKRGILELKKSVIVDNQNRDEATRRDYIQAYRECLKEGAGLSIRALCMDVPAAFCLHMNTVRAYCKEKAVPEVVIHSFYKKMEPPCCKTEGFTQVVNYGLKEDFVLWEDLLQPGDAEIPVAKSKLLTQFT